MKIRLPLPLVSKHDREGIGTVHSADDMSCSSESSVRSSRSHRSFSLSPRSRRRSRSRSRSVIRSFREESTNAAPQTTETKKSQSPPKKSPIMKRLQKSCNAILSNSSGHQRRSSLRRGREKENTSPSSNNTSRSVELSFDSSIVSLPNVPIPHPPSDITPKPSDLGVAATIAGVELARGKESNNKSKKTTKQLGVDTFTGDKGTRDESNVYAADCVDDEDEDDKYSPTSVATANSLLPPLFDSDDEEDIVQFSAIDPDEEIIGVSVNIEVDVHTNQHQAKQVHGYGDCLPLEHKYKVDDEIRYESKFFGNKRAVPGVDSELVSNHSKGRAAGVSSGGTQYTRMSSYGSSHSAGKSLSSGNSLEGARSLVYDSDEDNTGVGVGSGHSIMVPPKEVVAITASPASFAPLNTGTSKKSNRVAGIASPAKKGDSGDAFDGTNTKDKHSNHDVDEKEDDEKKTAQQLAVKLGQDIEELRQQNERYASKNRRLESKFQKLKAIQDENMIHRGRLVKACLLTSPVFILCGGLDSFLSTILLVWVLVEVDSYLDLSDEALDREEDDEGNSDDDDFTDDDHDDLDDDSSMSL
mmetsp:Transcript_25845/g.60853  ORF Transcript_25845/g.60853 Transcript_25845/m.60853 type:complete len:584 (+) Transcript_25845:270-2021(+)